MSMAATCFPTATNWLAAGIVHEVETEQFEQELIGEWIDLDRVRIDEGVLVLRGRRDRGPDHGGRRRVGRFGWTATISGVHGVLVKDRKRLGGFTIAEVRVSYHRLVLVSADGSTLTVERYSTITYEPDARPLPRGERLHPMSDLDFGYDDILVHELATS